MTKSSESSETEDLPSRLLQVLSLNIAGYARADFRRRGQ